MASIWHYIDIYHDMCQINKVKIITIVLIENLKLHLSRNLCDTHMFQRTIEMKFQFNK